MAQENEKKNLIISQLQKNVCSLETKVSKLSQHCAFEDHETSSQILNSKVSELDAHPSKVHEDNLQVLNDHDGSIQTLETKVEHLHTQLMKNTNRSVNTLISEFNESKLQNRTKFTNLFAKIELQNSKILSLDKEVAHQRPMGMPCAMPPSIEDHEDSYPEIGYDSDHC